MGEIVQINCFGEMEFTGAGKQEITYLPFNTYQRTADAWHKGILPKTR